jgi:hypothetical protein
VAAAARDYGRAIKDLAASNIFPGDLLTKNFGVTRHGRVVFYDYDELCFLTDCNFRDLPQPPRPSRKWRPNPGSRCAKTTFSRRVSSVPKLARFGPHSLFERHADLFCASLLARHAGETAGGRVARSVSLPCFMRWKINFSFTHRSASIAWLAWMNAQSTPSTPKADVPPEFQSDIELNATEATRVQESGQGAIETKKDPLPTAAARKAELGY